MTNINKQLEGYNGIYLERSGIDSAALTQTLVEKPTMPLGDEEKAEAYGFERQLGAYELREGVTFADVLRRHKGEDVVAPYFFADAFISGAVDAPEGVDMPEFHTSDDVYLWIADGVSNKSISPAILTSMAAKSSGVYKSKTAEALVNGDRLSEEDVESQSIVVNPEVFVQTSIDLRNARKLLLEQRAQYARNIPGVDGAKRAFVDVYLGKVNSLLAADIPVIDYLAVQSEMIGDEATQEAAMSIMPKGLRSALQSSEHRESTLRRLDYLRNGMGIDADGNATAVAKEVRPIHSPERVEALFAPEQLKKLQSYMVAPEQMQTIFTNILASAGKLSNEPPETWSVKRSHRASDELFQVVINPTIATFAVDGRSGAYKVASGPRSLYDVMVVGGAHELTHINQVEAGVLLSQQLLIADLKGKRISMLGEAGANMNQRAAEQELFGGSKPIVMTYARALQALESGKGRVEATEAFYKEKLRAFPDIDPRAAANEAADRVLRITRKGGFNSQPMVYAEESIMIDELQHASLAMRERASAITSIDLVDQVRLHQYDLLPHMEQAAIDWMPLVLKELDPYIKDALQV